MCQSFVNERPNTRWIRSDQVDSAPPLTSQNEIDRTPSDVNFGTYKEGVRGSSPLAPTGRGENHNVHAGDRPLHVADGSLRIVFCYIPFVGRVVRRPLNTRAAG